MYFYFFVFIYLDYRKINSKISMAQGKMKVKNSFVKKAKNRNQKPLGPKKGGKKCQSSVFIFKM